MAEVYMPDASQWINAFGAGQRMAAGRREEQAERARAEARRGIGAAMATGDYKTAAQLAYGAGDVDTGFQLQKRSDEIAAQGRKRDVLKAFQADPDAALNDALDVDPDLYKDLKGIKDDAEKQRYGQYAAVLRVIGREEPDRWDDLVAANRGQLEGLGIKPAEIDGFIQATPEQRVAMMAALLQRADQFDKYQTERHQDRTFDATQAEREADNKRADEQLRISRGSLGVSQGQLDLARRREGRVAAKGGSSGAGGGWEEF